MLPQIIYFFPEEEDGAQTAGQPSLIFDWNVDMETTQFSDASSRAQFFVLMDELTSTVISTDYVSYDVTNNRVTLKPSTVLDRGKTFRILVKSGLQSSEGRTFPHDFTWTFTTDGASIDAATLLTPANLTVQTSFPTLSWSNPTTGITFDIEIDEDWNFSSPTYTATTTGQSISPSPGSFTDGTTYFWRVLTYVDAVTAGVWSDVRRFYYGQAIDSDATTRQFYQDSDIFGVSATGFKDGLTNLSSWPTISITFTSEPATSYASHISIKQRHQIPRSDVASSFDITEVEGDWSLSGNTLTFTPSGDIQENTRYDIEILSTMVNTSGYVLNEEYSYYFSGKWSPLYVDSRAVRARFLSAEQQVPEDLIYYYIYESSLDANARFYAELYGDIDGDELTEAIVRDSDDIDNFPVHRWVTAAATYRLLKGILFENLRDIGSTTRLGDSSYSLTDDFRKALKDALELAKEELDDLDDYLLSADSPMWAQKNSRFNKASWDYDGVLYRIARRDDCF